MDQLENKMLSNPADVKLRHLIHLRQLHNSENMLSTACTEKMSFCCIPFVYMKKSSYLKITLSKRPDQAK